VNKQMYIESFVALGVRSDGNAPQKIDNQQLISFLRQCSSTPVGFGQKLLSK